MRLLRPSPAVQETSVSSPSHKELRSTRPALVLPLSDWMDSFHKSAGAGGAEVRGLWRRSNVWRRWPDIDNMEFPEVLHPEALVPLQAPAATGS